MTWNKLAELIAKMSEEQRDTDVTICVSDIGEYFGVHALEFSPNEDDILDANHPFLSI